MVLDCDHVMFYNKIFTLCSLTFLKICDWWTDLFFEKLTNPVVTCYIPSKTVSFLILLMFEAFVTY